MKKNNGNGDIAGSFRDPSGFVFFRDGALYRQVNDSYRENFRCLMDSGLYHALIAEGLMVTHEDAAIPPPKPDIAFKIIRPERIPFISFPYEWSFSQLRAAALATLQIQKIALQHGMKLKDASAYNIQFQKNKPILVDTLSFEAYRKGEVWVAYRQFCQHFLAPLALMALVDVKLGLMMRDFIDGIPLGLASRLLPMRSKLNISLLLHIHLHAKSQAKYSDSRLNAEIAGKKKIMANRSVSFQGLQSLISSLSSAVSKLRYKPEGTEWVDYYDDTNYSAEAIQSKAAIVKEFIDKSKPDSLWDLGGNTGLFGRIASEQGIPTILFDVDAAVVEKNYRNCIAKQEDNLLPLVLDLTNPSPAIGWENKERESLIQRGPVAMAMALALIHHLAIANNVPLRNIAHFFRIICRFLIIEFVPKKDSQVKRLLASREDIFPEYTKEGFERAFGIFFSIIDSRQVAGSERTLYLMRNNESAES
jgi:ribosomal protein L11 methylase PrmA